MKIKEAELLTGLSAKTIRFYESEGLIFVKRNLNGYRQYSEDTINELKKIKILRKLDFSISQIKSLCENKVLLCDLLKNRLKDLEQNELSMDIKKNIIEILLKDLKKDPNVNLSLYFHDFEYIESEEIKEFMNDINELKNVSLSHQILKTLMLSGPLLWWFYNIFNHKYEFMIINSILVIISTVILTLMWRGFFKQQDKKIRGTGYMLLSIF
ncbi:MerR family transcriptional regulator [Clostridium niameyense]|nr:MerR family transcriptional regulator [Clostridium niameyense]